MKETIFFVTFESGNGRISDRKEYFNSKKTLKEFHDWLEETRERVEKEDNTILVITNIQFIEK